MTPRRIFSVQAAGNAIRAHQYWRRGEDDPTQVAITFSSQIADFADTIGAELIIVAANPDVGELRDDDFTIEHWNKPTGSGFGYYLAELRYTLRLVRRAKRFGADLAILDSGTIPYFLMSLFRLAGVPVVVVLHNALWAAGFPHQSRTRLLIQRLDRIFFRRFVSGIVAVSPEVERQVKTLAGAMTVPIVQTRAQFREERFTRMPPADIGARPFRVLFAGRMVEEKGAFDLPAMARHCEDRAPGLVHWTLCGTGDALDEVRNLVTRLGLQSAVDVPGWTAPVRLEELYAASHAAIVPTRSSFPEGLAMSAIEPILAGRPLVSNSVVPALELVAPAAIEAKPDDIKSHAEAVLSLATDNALYQRLASACVHLGGQFYDREMGLSPVLRRLVDQIKN